jgi:hypothetical protein
MTSPEYQKTINSIRRTDGICGSICGVYNGPAAFFVNGAHRAGMSAEQPAGRPPILAPPPAMMTNVAPPPSGTTRVVQTAGSAPPPFSTTCLVQTAGRRNVMRTAITTNIAPPPSGTTIVVQTAGTMNVQPHQSGTTRVVQMPVTMNVAAPSGTTCLVIVAQSAGMFDIMQLDGTTIVPPSARTTDVVQTVNSDPLPAGKSNAQRKRRRANHKRNFSGGCLPTPSLIGSRQILHVDILYKKRLAAFLECRSMKILGKHICIFF